MPRDSPRRETPGDSSRFRDDRRDRYSRKDDRDDGYRGGSRRDPERDYGRKKSEPSGSRNGEDRAGAGGRDRDRDGRRDSDRDWYRNGDRNRGEDRGYGRGDDGRGRDDDRRRDRERDRDRDDRRAGPSRRSASPRARPSRPDSRSDSRAPSDAPEDKAKPNFGNSGLLAAATKTVQHGDGTKTVLKYHEPPEARKPTVGWRLYVFKGKEQVGKFSHSYLSNAVFLSSRVSTSLCRQICYTYSDRAHISSGGTRPW